MCESCNSRVRDSVASMADHLAPHVGVPLSALVAIRAETDRQIATEVARLRADHAWTWANVGKFLAITRQAAQQRYGSK